MSPGFSTRAIHVGQSPDPVTGDIIPPLHLASTFVMDRVGVPRAGYDYSRSGNPTRDNLQETLASLEGGEAALAFPSGLSAADTLLRAVTTIGGHVSFGADVYGGTYRLLDVVFPREGRTSTPLDLLDLDAVAADLRDNRAEVLWVETPSNPLLQVFDIAKLADLAHEVGALLVVDNTFASPALQRPLELGADVVTHSTTKYIGGHSDLIGGAVIGAADVLEKVAYLQNAVGAVPSAQDAYLTSRGLKTLAVRVRQQSATALRLAEFLDADPRVLQVNYPGLPSHPQHLLAARQMDAFGGVLSFTVADEQTARAVCEGTEIFQLAVSLGATESLIEHPAAMTHATKVDAGTAIDPALVRLAVGLEDPEDLIADIDRALG